MDKHVKEIFADYDYLLKNFKKKQYIKNMQLFRDKWDSILSDTVMQNDHQTVCEEFVKQVISIYSRFGKLGKLKKIDLGLFMVYFIFPSILLTQKEGAVDMADCLLNTWNSMMETNIEYMQYEEIVNNFNDKMFGIF